MFSTLVRSARSLAVAASAGLLLVGCPCLPGSNFVYFPDSSLERAVRASINQPFGCLFEGALLQARSVDAAGLAVSSLEGLENCSNLTELDLSNNNIKNIAELTNLQNLVSLDLSRNQITRIDALSGLFFLRYLDLSGPDNDIRDFSALTANALNGGLGDGAVVTLSTEWTVDPEGAFYADFADDYNALINAGVTVIFAENTGSSSAK